MPSNHTTRVLAAAGLVLVGVLALLYSLAVVAELLIGAGAFAGLLVLAAFVYYGGLNRRTLVYIAMAVTVVYGAFTLQLPAAVVAACVVYLTAWVTGSDSPLDAPDTTLVPVRADADRDTSEDDVADDDASGDAETRTF
ncbi:hypothetical protein GCM10009037_01600 [Halarchaeum grantii]|uniref:Uncharacterized protein n=1 Tax=Halarchaeum grantii TaxID=1193105 RepID=A0A830EYA4_9EURY|nr:hypothetical protein [Halarchaeum grantii]GGL21928.1 hypothetical protein GCM10009037_01600 [Halarchaeum grantii]